MIVFCYGTLRKGFHNHHFLDGAEYLGEARSTKDYSLQIDGLPFMQAIPGKGVVGELYRIDSEILRGLDYLESHPVFYKRVPIKLESSSIEDSVWAYLYSGKLSSDAQMDVFEYE